MIIELIQQRDCERCKTANGLTLKGPGAGGGIRPLDVSRGNFVEIS